MTYEANHRNIVTMAFQRLHASFVLQSSWLAVNTFTNLQKNQNKNKKNSKNILDSPRCESFCRRRQTQCRACRRPTNTLHNSRPSRDPIDIDHEYKCEYKVALFNRDAYLERKVSCWRVEAPDFDRSIERCRRKRVCIYVYT
jgi:hypothetical protein